MRGHFLFGALLLGALLNGAAASADPGSIQYDPQTGTYYNTRQVTSTERGQAPQTTATPAPNSGDFVEYFSVPPPPGSAMSPAPPAAPASNAPVYTNNGDGTATPAYGSGYAAWPPSCSANNGLPENYGYPYPYGGGGYGYGGGYGGYGGFGGVVFNANLPPSYQFTSFTPFPFTTTISTNPFAPATIVAAPFPFIPPIAQPVNAFLPPTGTIVPLFFH